MCSKLSSAGGWNEGDYCLTLTRARTSTLTSDRSAFEQQELRRVGSWQKLARADEDAKVRVGLEDVVGVLFVVTVRKQETKGLR